VTTPALPQLHTESWFPGLPDGAAYDLAAAFRGPAAFTEHLRAGGCPAPTHPEAVRSVLDPLEDEVHEVEGWTQSERDSALDAIRRIRRGVL
jgi:hypothetical protein